MKLKQTNNKRVLFILDCVTKTENKNKIEEVIIVIKAKIKTFFFDVSSHWNCDLKLT